MKLSDEHLFSQLATKITKRQSDCEIKEISIHYDNEYKCIEGRDENETIDDSNQPTKQIKNNNVKTMAVSQNVQRESFFDIFENVVLTAQCAENSAQLPSSLLYEISAIKNALNCLCVFDDEAGTCASPVFSNADIQFNEELEEVSLSYHSKNLLSDRPDIPHLIYCAQNSEEEKQFINAETSPNIARQRNRKIGGLLSRVLTRRTLSFRHKTRKDKNEKIDKGVKFEKSRSYSVLSHMLKSQWSELLRILTSNPDIVSIPIVGSQTILHLMVSTSTNSHDISAFISSTINKEASNVQLRKGFDDKLHTSTSQLDINARKIEESTLPIAHPPDKILLQVMSLKPECIACVDDRGRLPLHCVCESTAAIFYGRIELNGVEFSISVCQDLIIEGKASYNKPLPTSAMRLLVECFRVGATCQDIDGNLPLHCLAGATTANFTKSRQKTSQFEQKKQTIEIEQCSFEKSEKNLSPIHKIISKKFRGSNTQFSDCIKIMLFAYPSGISTKNRKGQLPIHIACASAGTIVGAHNSCIAGVQDILALHEKRKDTLSARDNNGNTPLHIAVKHRASHKVIDLFGDLEEALRRKLFSQLDKDGNVPLVIALNMKDVCPCVVASIIRALPSMCLIPSPSGSMPIRKATAIGLPSSVIKAFLLTDMPIEIIHADVVKPEMLVFEKSKTKELGHRYSFWHVMVECNDIYLSMIEDWISSSATQSQITALLRSTGPDNKTTIIEASSPKTVSVLTSLLRYNGRYEILSDTSSVLSNNGRNVQIFHAIDNDAESKIKPYNTGISLGDSNIEVSLLHSEKKRLVTLRCYHDEEAFQAEINFRERHKLDPFFTEVIYETHANYCIGDKSLCCITFEKHDHTLEEVFSMVSVGSRTSKWIKKCGIVLHQIANAIKHLHENGIIHGYLDPSTIAKFGSRWKLTGLGTATPVGCVMRGPLRSCAPPESISVKPLPSPISKLRISEDETDFIARVSFQNHVQMTILHKDTEPVNTFFAHGANELSKEKEVKCTHDFVPRDDFKDEGATISKSTSRSGKKLAIETEPHTKKEYEISSTCRGGDLKCSINPDLDLEVRMPQEDKLDDGSQPLHDYTRTFTPEICVASPSWDIWSFGLLAVQLLVGKSIYLPNFEKADDALLVNLSQYNEVIWKKLITQVRKAAGDGIASLIGKLLHPDPELRPNSMEEVLYFDENSTALLDSIS